MIAGHAKSVFFFLFDGVAASAEHICGDWRTYE